MYMYKESTWSLRVKNYIYLSCSKPEFSLLSQDAHFRSCIYLITCVKADSPGTYYYWQSIGMRTSSSWRRLPKIIFQFSIVTTGCLAVYVRFRRRNAQFASLSAEISGVSPPEETTSLVDNAEPVSITQSLNGKIIPILFLQSFMC